MEEFQIVRSLVLRVAQRAPATSPVAKAIVEWARPNTAWLRGAAAETDASADSDSAPAAGRRGLLARLLNRRSEAAATPADEPLDFEWDTLLAHLEKAGPRGDAPPQPLRLALDLADLLGFDAFDRALLTLMVACDRLPGIERLATIVTRHGFELPTLLGELAGAGPNDADRQVRRSAVLRLGLIRFVASRGGETWIDVRWQLERLLDAAPAAGQDMIAMLVGERQASTLGLGDFAHVAEAEFLVRLLRGALREKAAGVNLLIHGPPGTGKTELARVLAAAAGADLHAVGEADDDGAEPDRSERVCALHLAQRIMRTRGDAVLLFDEMEDMIGDASRSEGDWFSRRVGSKVFVNRLLETNQTPVVWTTNTIGNVDDAILRRMSFVLKLDFAPLSAALRMLGRIAEDEGVRPDPGFATLLETAPETSSVLRVAARASRLAQAGDGGFAAAGSLVRALRGTDLPDQTNEALDLDLFECESGVEPLFAALTGGADDVSLLLSGPPGTGKTAFARHMARALDRPLLVKRASDVMSKWVGGTERRIAESFAEARRRRAVLFFDEADSLLFDRTSAQTSWEVSQVNELLTWLDRHPLPVIAATNHRARLDPATLRRFVFKIELAPLGPEKAGRAFQRFFGAPPPAGLARLGALTPGDFAVVARQLRHAPAVDAQDLLARLSAECAAKPAAGRMGF